MANNKFYILNGEVEKREEFSYNFHSFMNTPYGIYTDIRLVNTTPLYLKEHIFLLEEHLKLLNIDFPRKLQFNKLETYIYRLLNINKIYKGGLCRLLVLQNHQSSVPDFFLYNEKLEHDYYTIKEKGFMVDILKSNYKKKDDYSGLKHNIDLLSSLAGDFCKKKQLDSCIILNELSHICEAFHGNIFFVKDMNIYTPSLNEGCKQEIIREKIIETALENGFSVYDDSIIKKGEILLADEIFIASDIGGIEWVQRYKNKRFFNKVAKSLTLLINKKIVETETALKKSD